MNTNKDLSFQAFRGLAIIAVVAIHASATGKLFINNESLSLNYEFSLIFRQFINYAVAVFIFISGFFTPKNYFSTISDYLIYYNKRLTRLLIPYLFWCFFVILFFKPNYNWNLLNIFRDIITGRVLGPYYFIIVLTQLIILTPLMISSTRNIIKSIFWLSLTPLSLLILYFFRLHLNYDLNFPLYAIPFSIWITFYYFGMLASHNIKIVDFCEKRIGIIILLYITSILFSITEGLFLWRIYGLDSFADSQIKISSFLSSFSLILLFIGLRKIINHWSKLLVVLGEFSFGIYLSHIFILDVLNKLMSKIGIIQNFYLISVFMATLTTMIICYLVISFTRKYIGINISQRYLGF